MNIIELSNRMASCQRAVKALSYKPDGSLFLLVDANKMEGGTNGRTLLYICLVYSISL